MTITTYLNFKAIGKCRLIYKLFFTLIIFATLTTAFAQSETPTRFAVIGDFGSGNEDEKDVANLVKSWNPDFVLTVGDNNYPDGEASTIDANIGQFYHDFIFPYTGGYGAGATVNRFFPALGNHDWETPGATPYLNYFTLPGNERYYDFVRGPVHFFMLDSDEREPDGILETSVQANWLRTKLAASTAHWKIVVLHHPPFSSRTSYTKLQWQYQQWGASAVLAGHMHLYERVLKNNFPYIVNGLGGESKGTFGTPIADSVVRFGDDYGAQLVTAYDNTITFQFFTQANILIDTYTITTVAPNAPSNLSATGISSSRVNLSWTDNSNNEESFRIERCQNASCTNFAEIAQVGRDVNSFQDTQRTANTVYRYRVRAFNNIGSSAYSSIAAVTTPQLPPVPSAPSNLAATAVSTRQINLSWTDNSANEEGFKIERCQNAGCTNFSEIAQTQANSNSFNNVNLLTDTTYVYRVRAFNEGGNSAFSNTIQTTTAPSATAVFSDNFDDGTRDPAKWNLGLLSRSASNFDSLIAVAESGGRLSIAPRASQTGSRYGGYVSAANWNLTDSAASVEVPQKASGNAVTIFSVGIDRDDWYSFRAKNNSLIFEYRRNGSTSATTLTYNAAQHRFWRLRHDAVSDSIIFETSADAVNWIARRTVAREFSITAMKIELIAGTGESVGEPGTALFDNFMLELNNPPPAPPLAPGNLTAQAQIGQINLEWTDNSNDEDSFKIERCAGANCGNFVQIAQIGMNVTSFSDIGLAEETLYRYRVRAFNSGADSPYSNIAEATTPTVPLPPDAPSNLTATTVSNTQINLMWSVNSATENGFDIERCTGIGCSNFVEIAEVGVDVSNFSDTGLAANTTYNYRVRAFNAGGNSAYSNIVGATTNNMPTAPPAPPTNLTANAVSTAQIDLSWTDNSTNESSFKIERCQNASCTNFAEIAQTIANAATFSDTGRQAGTIYRYRVRASNSVGNSAYTNIAETATPSSPPAAPSNLTASAQSASQINLLWTDNSLNENGFKIERCQNTGCSNFAEIAQVAASVTFYEDAGRAANTAYVYRVRAFNAGGNSAYSNIAEAQTTGSGSEFTDDFDDGVRDSSKWNIGIFTTSQANFDSLISVTEQNGRLNIAPRASRSGLHYNGYVSVSSWNLTNAFASVQVAQKANGNAQTIFSIGADGGDFYRFRARGSTLYLEQSIGGSISATSISSTNDPRYWRFRHDATADAIIFETSADNGATWIVRRTVARQIPIGAMKIELIAGTGESVASPGTTLFDNFRLTANASP